MIFSEKRFSSVGSTPESTLFRIVRRQPFAGIMDLGKPGELD
jgi:hypothetical protein